MKKSFNLKTMFTIFLAAPFLVLIVMIFIFAGIVESRSMTEDLLKAPKYMIKPILNIIENNFQYTEKSDGVLLLLDHRGKIIYPRNENLSVSSDENLSSLYLNLLESDLDTISMSKYIYRGEPGFCFFDNTHIPVMLKQHIRIGISLFIVIISCMGLVFGQISSVIINNSIKNLVVASNLIANGNLDQEITLSYNNELIHVAKAMDRMRLELREKRNIEQRFVMSVTHDLKTPLTSINGYLEAMADGFISDPQEIKDTISLMQRKSELLDNRINELLDYSKNRTAGWRENWNEINILNWLNDISQMFQNDASLYGRKYSSFIDIDPNDNLLCNDKLLTRALENLFDNACRYSKEDDLISIKASKIVRESKDLLQIVIEDSGLGIDEKDMQKIFELFYRNDRGRNSRGMGIGLASVQTIIKDHGGNIYCSKSDTGGARFTIELESL